MIQVRDTLQVKFGKIDQAVELFTGAYQYAPFSAVIKAGQNVTWQVPATSRDPHTISWPPIRGQEIAPIPVDGKPPILAVGKTLAPLTVSGTSVKNGDPFSSGLVFPGQTFTLTFTEPGAYPYVCNIHPGMRGVIVVQPN